MGHEAKDIAGLVADTGNPIDRTVRIHLGLGASVERRIAEDDPPLIPELSQSLGIRPIRSIRVRDGQCENLSGHIAGRKRRIGPLDPNTDHSTHETERRVAQERPRQEARLDQNLKAITNPQNQTASVGVRSDRVHDGR